MHLIQAFLNICSDFHLGKFAQGGKVSPGQFIGAFADLFWHF